MFLNVKPYIQLLLCVYGIYFAAKYIFQRFIKSQSGFSNAGAGYTFYPHSLATGLNIKAIYSVVVTSPKLTLMATLIGEVHSNFGIRNSVCRLLRILLRRI